MNAFEEVVSTYEKFGRDDPFYAVLSQKRYRKKNLNKEEFYENGQLQIARLMADIENRNLSVGRCSALDFGCGVGRLTNALCPYFSEVTGVDVSSSMVETAVSNQRYPNCKFVVNTQQDLSIFNDGEFDFIFSDITLQHIPMPASVNYIKDFMRILRPGGLAIFLVPDGPDFKEGSIPFRINRFYRQQIRPWHKRLRGKPPVQVHYISRPRIESIIQTNNARLIDTQPLDPTKIGTFRYNAWYYWVQTGVKW